MDYACISTTSGFIYGWNICKHRTKILLKSNIESFLMQIFDSINFKLRPMNIYCDCCFIDKLYYKMLIHKLIAFLRKDTFFCLILRILWNPTKYCCENKQVWLWLYIYIYIYIYTTNSFSFYFISDTFLQWYYNIRLE